MNFKSRKTWFWTFLISTVLFAFLPLFSATGDINPESPLAAVEAILIVVGTVSFWTWVFLKFFGKEAKEEKAAKKRIEDAAAVEKERVERQKDLDEAKKREMRIKKEQEERERLEQVEREIIQGFLDDITKLIPDEQEQEKISSAFLSRKHSMGMPKRHVDFIYGEFFDPKETVTKKTTKVTGKYIQTGTNKLGNPTYKYEMTFEDGFLVGWKDL